MTIRLNYARGRNKSIEKTVLIEIMEDAKKRFFEGGGTITVIQSKLTQKEKKKHTKKK